jgi:hypothetical protein
LSIRFYDAENDVFVNMDSLNAGQLEVDATLQSDIVAYIKTRMAAIPGAGTITAKETLPVTTNI